MRRRGKKGGLERWLNGATAVVLVVAVALLVRDRVVPAWRAGQVVTVGDEVPAGLDLVSLASGDTAATASLRPALLLYFQSTCPACTRNLPAWRRLLEERPSRMRAVAIGLEDRAPALSYAREELPGALAVRPADRRRLIHVMAVEAVPTTQLVDRDGRLLWSRTGVLGAADVERALDRARGVSPAGSGPAGDAPLRTPDGRTP